MRATGSPAVSEASVRLPSRWLPASASGRVCYVVRLVRKSVRLSRDKVRAAARGGELSTREIGEFERFLPLFSEAAEMSVGDFPWARVPRHDHGHDASAVVN